MQFGGVYYCHMPRLSIESSRKMVVESTLSKKSILGLQRFAEWLLEIPTSVCGFMSTNWEDSKQPGFVIIPENDVVFTLIEKVCLTKIELTQVTAYPKSDETRRNTMTLWEWLTSSIVVVAAAMMHSHTRRLRYMCMSLIRLTVNTK